jgi:hypothetical protein
MGGCGGPGDYGRSGAAMGGCGGPGDDGRSGAVWAGAAGPARDDGRSGAMMCRSGARVAWGEVGRVGL